MKKLKTVDYKSSFGLQLLKYSQMFLQTEVSVIAKYTNI